MDEINKSTIFLYQEVIGFFNCLERVNTGQEFVQCICYI